MFTDVSSNYNKEVVKLADERYLIYYDFNRVKSDDLSITRKCNNLEDK